MDKVRQHEIELTKYALEKLGKVKGIIKTFSSLASLWRGFITRSMCAKRKVCLSVSANKLFSLTQKL